MTRTIHLHIGRAKTGTTAIQAQLNSARESLASDGICYPRTGLMFNRPSQEGIALACYDNSEYSEDELVSLRNAFEEEVADCARVIVSSEGFQNITDVGRLSFFFRRQEVPQPYEIETVCCLREYLDLVRSAYAQHVQATSLTATFEEFCAQFSRFDLSEFLGRWNRFSDSLEVISYDHAMTDGGIVSAFFKIANIPGHLDQAASVNSNPSISGNLLAFKLRLNSLTQHRPEFYAGLHRLALQDSRYRGPFKIGRPWAALLRASDNGYNRIFAERCGEISLRDFEDGQPMLEPAHWAEDVDRFLSDRAFETVRDIEALRDLPEMTPA